MAIQMLYQSDLGNVPVGSVLANFRPQEYLRDDESTQARTEDQGEDSGALRNARRSAKTNGAGSREGRDMVSRRRA